jgi:anti-sigma factor RsiW
MTNDPVLKRFLEISWRRKLNSAEETELRAWLEAHPESSADWEMEAGMSDALRSLSDVHVPTNFNARVMQEIERGEALKTRHGQTHPWWRRLIPRLAVGAVVLAAGVFSYEQVHHARVRETARKAEVVENFVSVSKKVELLEPETLENFDTIRQGADLVADEKLLTLLQ